MLIFLAGLRQIPTELYEAAAIDGAGAWSRFFRITLPLLSPVIFFNLVMQTISGFMVFTRRSSSRRRRADGHDAVLRALPLPAGFESFQMGYASAMAWVLLVAVALCTAVLFKTSAHWVFYEAKEGR